MVLKENQGRTIRQTFTFTLSESKDCGSQVVLLEKKIIKGGLPKSVEVLVLDANYILTLVLAS